MKIVFLDRKSVGEDIDLSKFKKFGEWQEYDLTAPEKIPERIADADIILTNKLSLIHI